MLTCYIVDDEIHSLEIVKSHVLQTEGLTLLGSTNDPLVALKELKSLPKVDVLFTDIDMPGINGLELAELVGRDSTIVIMTAHPDFALDAYEREVFAYIVKPISYARFLKIADRLKQQLDRGDQPDHLGELYLKSDLKGKIFRLELGDIIYVESAKNHIIVGTAQEKITAYMKISDMDRHLPATYFSRVHRSFIINHRHISHFTNQTVVMKNQTHIPLGDKYRNEFLNKIGPHLLNSDRLSS